MPVFRDMEDDLDPGSDHFESAATKTQLATTAGEGRIRWGTTFTFVATSHREQRIWLYNQENWCGMARPFWVPSWVTDFRLLTDVTPNARNLVYVQKNGFERVFETDRYGLMFELPNGSVDIYKIAGYDPILGNLILANPIAQVIALTEVMRCCLIRRVRAATDLFDWDFVHDGAFSVGVPVTEVFGEGAFV